MGGGDLKKTATVVHPHFAKNKHKVLNWNLKINKPIVTALKLFS
jgi:hypothetical protein